MQLLRRSLDHALSQIILLEGLFEFYNTTALYSLMTLIFFFFFNMHRSKQQHFSVLTSAAQVRPIGWLLVVSVNYTVQNEIILYKHCIHCVGMLKIKPNHNHVSVDVNVIILPLRLLVLCALQAFTLSGFLCKPQREEESRCCASASLLETLSKFSPQFQQGQDAL